MYRYKVITALASPRQSAGMHGPLYFHFALSTSGTLTSTVLAVLAVIMAVKGEPNLEDCPEDVDPGIFFSSARVGVFFY